MMWIAVGCSKTGPVSESSDHWDNLESLSFKGFDVSNAIILLPEIENGGPPRDGIPALDQPEWTHPSEVDYLSDADRVVSVLLDGQARAYPLRILVWHEIVNDVLEDHLFAVTYCPLCGTAMVFDRRINGVVRTFGVSGLLYQNDVLMFDRETESLWSQLGMKAVSGPDVRAELTLLPSEQMTWAAWRKRYPDGQVLSVPGDSGRNYQANPFADYELDDALMFPVTQNRTDLLNKTWVIGVWVDGYTKAYPLPALAQSGTVRDIVNEIEIELSWIGEEERVLVRSLTEERTIPWVQSYWFAWQAFYPQTELWDGIP